MGRARRLTAEERGFSMIELLTAMTVGMVVLLGGYKVLDDSSAASGRVTSRADATQRGRVAMDGLTRPLRSQACLDSTTPAFVDARPNSVEFYSDVREEDFRPDRHLISFDSANATITDTVWESTGTSPTFTFPSTPTRVRVLATNVAPVGTLFRYYAYRTTSPITPEAELTPVGSASLTAAERARVVRVVVAFSVTPDRTAQSNGALGASTFEDDVYARLSDPERPLEGPLCA